MAVIHEEIVLADRFSAVFTQYMNMLRQAASASTIAAASQRQFDTASIGASSALVRMAGAALDAASAMGGVDDDTRQMSDACERAARSQDRMNQSMRQGQSAASGLESRLLSLVKAYASVRTAQAFIGLTDTFTETSARLDLVKNKFGATVDLQNMLYQSAQRTGTSYLATADAVAKMALNAGAAFNNLEEVVAFMEQVNKQFLIAGASTQEQKNAIIQLTQAMASGTLRGDELGSILDQAPGIARAIETYMGYAEGSIKRFAETGDVTAQVVKNALFYMAEETDAAAEKIPLTFGRVWERASSSAVKAMEPAMTKLNALLNSDLGKNAVNGLISAFELLGSAASGAVDLLAAGAQWLADNWNFVSTVLQFAGGAVLAFTALSVASSLKRAAFWAIEHWQILLFVAVIGMAITTMYAMGMTSEEVFGRIGAIMGALYTFGYNLVASAWNLLASFGEFFANFLDNPIAAIVHLLADLADFALSILQTIAGGIDAVFGSNLAGAVNGWRSSVKKWADDTVGEKRVKIERMALLDVHETMAQWSNTGAGIGKALDNFNVNDILSGFSGSSFDYSAMLNASGMPQNLDAIKTNTAAIKRSVSLSEEDMKMLVDMAERRYVNNINLTAQTPVITINGQNTGDTAEDLQWLENALTKLLMEQAASHTDLSYQ